MPNYKTLHQLDMFLLLTVFVQNVDIFKNHVTALNQIPLFYITLYSFSSVRCFCLRAWFWFVYIVDFVLTQLLFCFFLLPTLVM
jgi:hypothetical protein